ncbi:MBL fold metallo-hydrolase [Palleronia sp. LCG004]|uniref:MBL fold metallo-hydrolase n=1 Tax=Palleronia sp. LCG004 TaxID=3079304 RepID=UPI0029429429|nr:MBL fold metallo-hydrolase [Palleronia sp. LCG004]WOI55466.1 MBL fold metallo-hydrolase [Palleronia sp. LCG004]
MKLDHVNCLILDEGDGSVTVIDTGFDTPETRDLWARVLGGRRVGRIVVTHHHPDHVGLAGWFQSQGAELWMSRVAWLTARMLLLDIRDLPAPETVEFWKACGMDREILARRITERPFNFADMLSDMPLGLNRLEDGARIAMGGRDWIIRMGQGHAPDQATFWCEAEDLVIGADQLLPSISPNLSLYATEPDADPVGEWLASCERFLEIATANQLVLPGHKMPYRGLPLRLGQLIANHQGALERLLHHISEPRTAGECFAPLFKRRIGSGEYGLALGEAAAHCRHLVHLGRATREMGSDGAWYYTAL